jgi:hypothetical protein
MTHKTMRSILFSLAIFSCLAVFQQTALAGPPLLCHPFEIGNARSLPWAGTEWRAVKKDYDLNQLVNDTLALLTNDMPVIVRMETLRRATIYSVWATRDEKVGYAVKDLKVANELLSRLMARTQSKGQTNALALFDAGYFAESCKQATGSAFQGIDGYDWVAKAISLRKDDSAMNFAAALITLSPSRSTHQQHLQKAVSGAVADSLLSHNLDRYFATYGKKEKAL